MNACSVRFCLAGWAALFISFSGQGPLKAQQQSTIVVDVIGGPTCIHAPRVYRITSREIGRILRSYQLPESTFLLHKWTVPETEVPSAMNLLLDDKPLGGGAVFPVYLSGYGSPTVLINATNITHVPASPSGHASCAGILPDRKLIRESLEQWARPFAKKVK
jgi:hypothetical protein